MVSSNLLILLHNNVAQRCTTVRRKCLERLHKGCTAKCLMYYVHMGRHPIGGPSWWRRFFLGPFARRSARHGGVTLFGGSNLSFVL